MRGSLGQSAIEFLAWWRDELSGLAPASLRKAFESGAETAIVQEMDGNVVLRKRGSAPRTLTANGKPPGGLPKGGVVYLLPEDGALRRERRLPSASRAHIQDIMNLEMASETPFTIEEVYADSIITDEVDATREIVVAQALAPRAPIDEIITRMQRDYGLGLAGIDVATPTGARAGFNLLPAVFRHRAAASHAMTFGILLAVLAASALFAGLSWRDLQQRRIDAAEAMLTDTTGGAAGAMQVSTRVAQGIEGIQRLAAEQRDPASFLRVYDEVADLLPDGTWLEEFSYQRPTAFLTGLSANSATLVQAFESSALVQSARFASPIVTDPQTGAERFRLEVTFKAPGAPAPAEAPQPAGEPQQ
jgi:general secretion pathway protein L